MIYKRMKCTDVLIQGLLPMMEAHFLENATKFYGVFSPNFSTYEQLEAGGFLRMYVVVHRGEIIGYQVFIVTEHAHAQDLIVATQDALYIAPAHRTGFTAYKFIKWCHGQLREDGISVVHQIVPSSKGYGPMFERMGCEAQDVVYSKMLQEVA